jgi:hypothetical protein
MSLEYTAEIKNITPAEAAWRGRRGGRTGLQIQALDAIDPPIIGYMCNMEFTPVDAQHEVSDHNVFVDQSGIILGLYYASGDIYFLVRKYDLIGNITMWEAMCKAGEKAFEERHYFVGDDLNDVLEL